MNVKLNLQLKIKDRHKQTPLHVLDFQGKLGENTKIVPCCVDLQLSVSKERRAL